MLLSRRDLHILLPALAAGASAQTSEALPSKVYHDRQVPYTGDDKKKGRSFFHGVNRSGFDFEMHETILSPGTRTHAPHKHEHEEIVVVFEGTVETWLEGKTETAETGSVIYFASNQMHSTRNIGSGPSRYYVIELRGSKG
ncbi:MAG TPA: cupin domain-containing protein [Bryobacteraceae bacterium]|nr:cupin domain-containing protein [Bryobacteraceae bacterium]